MKYFLLWLAVAIIGAMVTGTRTGNRIHYKPPKGYLRTHFMVWLLTPVWFPVGVVIVVVGEAGAAVIDFCKDAFDELLNG